MSRPPATMDEGVALAKIVTLVTKDVLLAPPSNPFLHSGPPSLYAKEHAPGVLRLQSTLLDDTSDDEEALSFFFRQHFDPKSVNSPPPKLTPAKRGNPTDEVPRPKRRLHRSDEGSPDASQGRRLPQELNLLNLFESSAFEAHLHMSKSTFLECFQATHPCVKNDGADSTSPQMIFSLSLWKLTTDEHFEEIARRFECPLGVCRRYIRQYWRIISERYERFIKWPNSLEAQRTTVDGFRRHEGLQRLDGLFAVVAIKRLDIFLTAKNSEVPVVLQIVCNADLQILDCFVEHERHYSFDASPIGQTLAINGEAIPTGGFLVGDTSFPLKHNLMRPFALECFQKETLFNRLLAPALLLGQNCLDTMAKRFHMLYATEARDMLEMRQIFETVCALHNLCVKQEDDYVARETPVDAVRFNWSTDNGRRQELRGREQDHFGQKRRCDLVELWCQ